MNQSFEPDLDKDRFSRHCVVAFCLGLVALTGLLLSCAGCSVAPPQKNYAALAELTLAEFESPTNVKVEDCPCNGTKKVGDGDNAVPCPCGIHCPCKPKQKPPEVIKHPNGTALTCPCNGKEPCPCGTNCMCQLLRDHRDGKIKLPPAKEHPQAPPVVIQTAPTDQRGFSNPPRRRRGLFRVR